MSLGHTAIYTFSGTGNSLHVARELQRRLPASDLVPIVRLLGDDAIVTGAETVGLVFPNFCLTVPIPVHDFLQRADLSSARTIFAVCTRGGSPSEAFDVINDVLRRQGRALDAQLNVTMPWNHCLGPEDLIALNTPERVQRLEAEMERKLDLFAGHVLAHESYLEPDTEADLEIPRWAQAMAALIPRSLNYGLHRFMYQDLVQFYSDARCNGCGICERVCLSRKIALVDGSPVWSDDARCYGCFACINYCPRRAIQIRSCFPVQSSTQVTGRYHHPSVTYKDIAAQR